MAQIQVLDFKAARRLEPVGDERNEQPNQGKREKECADSALTCQDRMDRVFGRDRYDFFGLRIDVVRKA